MEMEARIRKSRTPAERPPAEKIWKMHDREWWNDKQVAKVIGIAVTTLRSWRSEGKGPTYQRIGKRVLYSKSDVLEFMNSSPKIKRRE